MDKRKLEKYRKLLLKEKENILKSKFSDDVLEKIGVNESGDIVDIASKLYETDFFLQLASHDQDTLKLIDQALEKINDGTYGICAGTGKAINEARLEAIPWTPYSIEYAQELAKKKSS